MVIWASAAFAGYESIRKLVDHGTTGHVALGIVGAALGIVGNQVVARYKLMWAGASTPRRWSRMPGTPGWMPCPRPGALAGLVAVSLGLSAG